MAFTRRRVLDFVAAASGVLIVVIAVAIIDQRFRHQFTTAAGSADLATVGEDVHNVSAVVALMVAQFFRGQLVEHMHFMVFTATAIVLVVLLMRL